MSPYIVNKVFKCYTDVLYFLLNVKRDCIVTETKFTDEVYYRESTSDYKVIVKII